MTRILTLAVALVLVGAPASGADIERDRKARVALALAGAGSPAITSAPAPRVVIPKDYATGYRLATAEQCPLVVFVGTDPKPVPGAVACKYDAPTFGAIEGPAVVVTYPVGSRLLIEGAVAADAPPEAIVKKIDAAKRKIDAAEVTKDVIAPKPLEWDIRAEPNGCKCGPGCLCLGTCPGCAEGAKAKPVEPRDALVRVRCGNGSGSGTVVFSARHRSVILTAAHVLSLGGETTVRGGGKWHRAVVLATDEVHDLAALLVEADLPAVKVSAADPAAGTEVLMIGVTSLWSKGTIAGREKVNDGDRYTFQTDAGYDFSAAGDSGGGVFVKGELVGVHCGRLGASASATHTPYAAGARSVRGLMARVLKRDGVTVAPVAAAPPKQAAPDCPDGKCPLVRPAAGTSAAPVAGTLTTTTGRLIRPNGRGGYEYADQGATGAPPAYLPAYPFGAPSCPGGNCPAPRR